MCVIMWPLRLPGNGIGTRCVRFLSLLRRGRSVFRMAASIGAANCVVLAAHWA